MMISERKPRIIHSGLHVAEVVAFNAEADPNRFGRPLPRNHVYIRMPWLKSAENPDPVSAHPVPVYVNHFHTPGRRTWEQLPPGTRVLVAEVEKVPGVTTLGLAVVALGPANSDQIYEDTRQTAHYQDYPDGSQDRIVSAEADPVEGPNADFGHTHLDGRGYGWQTRAPYPDDPQRDLMDFFGPTWTLHVEHKKDDSVQKCTLTFQTSNGPYVIDIDGVARKVLIDCESGKVKETLDPVAQKVITDKGGDSFHLAQYDGSGNLQDWVNNTLLPSLEAAISARTTAATAPVYTPYVAPRAPDSIATEVLKSE